MRYFDPIKKQLIYIKNKATPDLWDREWNVGKNNRNEIIGEKNTYVSIITKRYLKPEDGIILEGGCGKGEHVASLANEGYRVIGIDWAVKTVKKLNQYVPELDIRPGDVRKLLFNDNYFIGYWSLGVIQHYWRGYQSIALEMSRVIKEGGYLFLAFPYMSPLRRVKSKLGLYALWQKTVPDDNFFAFNLNPKLVIENFQKLGFQLIKSVPLHAIKGTKDEIPVIKPLLQKLHDYKGSNIFVNFVRRCISTSMSSIAANTILLILKK